MDTIKRAIELVEERTQAFGGARQELLDAYEAEAAGSKKKARKGKKVPLSSVGQAEDRVTQQMVLDGSGQIWDPIEKRPLAPDDSVILPRRYHYERRVAGRAGGICAPDGTKIAYDVELPEGTADFVVFDRKHTLEQVVQGEYDFRVRYERHDVDANEFERFAQLAEGLLPEARAQLDRHLLIESAGDGLEDVWCISSAPVPVLLARLAESEPGVVTFEIHLPWSERRRDTVKIELAPGCLGKGDEPGEYDQYGVMERAKRDFAGRLALHAFSVGAPVSAPLELASELAGRPATCEEFERLCDLMLANFIGMRNDGIAYEDWCVISKGHYGLGTGTPAQVAANLLRVAAVFEAQAGFVSADDFEVMRRAFLARFSSFVAYGFGKDDDSLIKCIESMEVTA